MRSFYPLWKQFGSSVLWLSWGHTSNGLPWRNSRLLFRLLWGTFQKDLWFGVPLSSTSQGHCSSSQMQFLSNSGPSVGHLLHSNAAQRCLRGMLRWSKNPSQWKVEGRSQSGVDLEWSRRNSVPEGGDSDRDISSNIWDPQHTSGLPLPDREGPSPPFLGPIWSQLLCERREDKPGLIQYWGKLSDVKPSWSDLSEESSRLWSHVFSW